MLQRICLGLIRGYRYLLSPLLPPSCRFTPSCSRYAIEAIETHGTWRGLLLALGRIARCQPFCQGGYDPVPPVSGNGCQGGCGQRRGNKKCNTQTLPS
ncbi:MAG: membrane protein insertion efficiency factor YidD [Proteobacteria bacterium]|nr:membrane protein insertion efficiency factor YidD [Pseudomonadota bacterium]MBU1060244.1 membrane protein insertion efficiency factor YidD [Pseudomonadota bacterium]